MPNIKFYDPYLSIKQQITDIYQADKRPWVIGYSGGKDSTLVVQLVFEALSQLRPHDRIKQVYIISSNTLVENPVIISHIDYNLGNIQQSADAKGLPVSTYPVKPEYEKSFWVNLIGRGYPSPRQHFRWCTDRLKIEPTNKFIRERISEYGEVIVVLGVRKAESSSRAQVLEKHRIENHVLKKHTSLTNAYVFAPIEDLSTDEVWRYLLADNSPWDTDHHKLLDIYQDSSEEPVFMLDKSAPAAGTSRFGCWTCTVVKEDKALVGFINNNHPELEPLLKFRNYLYQIRDNPKKRELKRKNGSIYYIGKDDTRRRGLGPFTLEARKEMLQELLTTQSTILSDSAYTSKYGFQLLISEEELKLIDNIWMDQGNWENSVPKIFQQIIGKPLQWQEQERPLFTQDELRVLEDACNENDIPLELVHKLLKVEEKHYGYKFKHGLYKEMHSILCQDWLHIDEDEVTSNDF